MVRTDLLKQMKVIEEQERTLFIREEVNNDFTRFVSQSQWIHMRAFNSGRLSAINQAIDTSLLDDVLTERHAQWLTEDDILKGQEVSQAIKEGKKDFMNEIKESFKDNLLKALKK